MAADWWNDDEAKAAAAAAIDDGFELASNGKFKSAELEFNIEKCCWIELATPAGCSDVDEEEARFSFAIVVALGFADDNEFSRLDDTDLVFDFADIGEEDDDDSGEVFSDILY